MTNLAVWAPRAVTVEIDLSGDRLPMSPESGPGARAGWWSVDLPPSAEWTDYRFVLDAGAPLPDPRSRWQPHGVHGPSRIVDLAAFDWHDDAWHGIPLAGGVVYELHVGTFTEDGTLDAAIERLDHLVELGVSHVELMPLAAFPGRHGWGYDGVALWAVHEPYGGPAALQRFVDACHAQGLAVLLDVVYNHLGPSGNYLDAFGPYFTERHHTPWGPAVNLDDHGADEVRRFIIDNALMWLRDYHVDGLRLDAVHALVDDTATHILEELAVEVDTLATSLRRPLSLVAESDLNDPRLVTAREAGGYGLTAQWSDDFHHALHCLLTGERQGYYLDFGSYAGLAKTLTGVFFHDGSLSTFRGRRHGRPIDTGRLPGSRFLGYLQDHDQIGNRATGDRISASLSPGMLKVGAALVLTSPFTPMLFMGEEWGASTPWQYFTDHPEPELADAVRDGRRSEFAHHGWAENDIPDPQHPSTFERSRLFWPEVEKEPHAGLLEFHRRLIALRRARPELSDPTLALVDVTYDEQSQWLVMRRGWIAVACNLAVDRQQVPLGQCPVALLLASETGFAYSSDGIELDGESVAFLDLGGPPPQSGR